MSFLLWSFWEDNSQFHAQYYSGRKFRRREACLFLMPSLMIKTQRGNFPSRHFIGWTTDSDTMRDGFAVCRDYFHRAAELENPGYIAATADHPYLPCRIKTHLNFPMPSTSISAKIYCRSYNEHNFGAIWLLWKTRKKSFIAVPVYQWPDQFCAKAWPEKIDFIFPEKLIFYLRKQFQRTLNRLPGIGYLYANNFEVSTWRSIHNDTNRYFRARERLFREFCD